MIDRQSLRAMALAQPGATDDSTPHAYAFGVGGKGFAWSWKERIDPKKPRIPRLDVLAVRCARPEKETILESDPQVFFTEPHYNGFPAVLVRLDRIDPELLREMLSSAWLAVAPRPLVKAYLASR
jgi:hypothetical protein